MLSSLLYTPKIPIISNELLKSYYSKSTKDYIEKIYKRGRLDINKIKISNSFESGDGNQKPESPLLVFICVTAIVFILSNRLRLK